ncbi:MAG: AAA family ATPase, partial [Thermocrispum sp.]
MLAEMRIQGVGVIDDALLELHPGFTVVTGETGAGKTMVVTGLHLLSGGRSDATRVRSGAPKAVVEGRFELAALPAALAVAEEAGAEADDDGSLIALRSVGKDGRSRAHVGGRSVPVGVLSQLSEQLIAVHGQNDQLRLLRPAEQLAVLDRFAGEPVAEPLAAYQRVRAEWQAVVAELAERTGRSRELAQQADLLRHGLAEIAAVDPQPAEGERLAAEVKRLAEADELRSAAQAAQLAVAGAAEGDPDQPGALGLAGEARRRLGAAGDPELAELEPRLQLAAVLLTDVGAELGAYLERLDADPERLERVLARQADLKKLTRKYAADVDGVLAWAADAEQRLASMDTSEEALAALAMKRDELADELCGQATRVSKARRAAADELGAAITAELSGLAMGQAEVDITVEQRAAGENDPAALKV